MLDIHKERINKEYSYTTVILFRCDKLRSKETVLSLITRTRGEEMQSEKKTHVLNFVILNMCCRIDFSLLYHNTFNLINLRL